MHTPTNNYDTNDYLLTALLKRILWSSFGGLLALLLAARRPRGGVLPLLAGVVRGAGAPRPALGGGHHHALCVVV